MIWRKNRSNANDNWQVYHFGVNGGTNPHLYRLRLNTNNAEDSDAYTWVNAPTATHFTVGSNGSINRDNDDFLTILFASVTGISSVGSYTGSNPTSVSTGFQPRFILIKRVDDSGDWFVFDSVRGINSSTGGNDARLYLNETDDEFSNSDYVSVSSTGFTVNDYDVASGSSTRFIYYAHA